MMRSQHLTTTILTVGAALLLSACSLSNGAGSASDSSGSLANSSGSSANSSGGNAKAAAADVRYASDVQDYTASYARSNSHKIDPTDFMQGLSEVAAQNGVVDWEAHPKTYQAIGQSLKQVRLSSSQYQTYKNQLGNGDSHKIQAIQRGYDH